VPKRARSVQPFSHSVGLWRKWGDLGVFRGHLRLLKIAFHSNYVAILHRLWDTARYCVSSARVFYYSKFLIVVFLYFYVATVSAIFALLCCSVTFYFTYSFTMQINYWNDWLTENSPILTYRTSVWRPRWRCPRWNYAEIFGFRKLCAAARRGFSSFFRSMWSSVCVCVWVSCVESVTPVKRPFVKFLWPLSNPANRQISEEISHERSITLLAEQRWL